MVYKWLSIAHEWCLPSQCVLCGRAGSAGRDLCIECLNDLPFLRRQCVRCALPLQSEGVCGRCQKKTPAYDRTEALFHYGAPLNGLLQSLKFNGKLYNARLLGGLMAEYLAHRLDPLPSCIMPVPLHPARLRERGFNQALELARPISKRWGVPLDVSSCRRTKATAPQSGLGAQARHKNLQQAFELTGAVRVPSVLIIDDVMTTGSTLEAMAALLKLAGVMRVEVCVCARAG